MTKEKENIEWPKIPTRKLHEKGTFAVTGENG